MVANETTVGWVSVPNDAGRGTIDIIFSCFSVLVICTWTVTHPDIPSSEELRAPWTSWLYWKDLFRKPSNLLLTVIAPEVRVGQALAELMLARASVKELRDYKFGPNLEPWTYTHGQFAVMEGFAIKTSKKGEGDMFELVDDYRVIPIIKNESYRAALDDFMGVTYEDINDRSKSDSFTRVFAIVQSLWLIVQCIGRSYQDLAISQLELFSMTFVFTAVVIYILWWTKPYNVTSRVILPIPYDGNLASHFNTERPNKAPEAVLSRRCRRYSICAVGVAFGALHLIAWNWSFPTQAEKYMWRVCSGFICGGPILLIGLVSFDAIDQWDVTDAILMTLAFLYCAARILVIALVISSLRSMPASVYHTVDWGQYLPQFV